jgi:NADH dehydrogenase
VRAAERAGTKRFLFFSAMGASLHSRTRFFRAKALAEKAVRESQLDHTIFWPSITYAPGDPWLTLLERISYLPAVPVSGSGDALYQPIWAEDVAECVMRVLDGARANGRGGFDLAGPETLSYDDIVRTALDASGRSRPLVHLPLPVVQASLRALEKLAGQAAFATWEEAELMEEPMVTPRGTADPESLGVTPLRMRAVLGAT